MALKGINIVLSGSGSAYINQAGALQALMNFIYNNDLAGCSLDMNFVGCSGGAITAGVYFLYVHNLKSNKDFKEIITAIPPQKVFKLNKKFWQPKEQIGLFNLNKLSKYTAKAFKDEEILSKKFGNVTYRTVAYNVLTEKLELLEPQNTSIKEVMTIAAASASIPFLFTPTKYSNGLYVDGGIQSSFPVDVFEDSEYLTIGLRAVTVNNKWKIVDKAPLHAELDFSIENRVDYMQRIFNAPFEEIEDEQTKEMIKSGKLLIIPVYCDSKTDFVSKTEELEADFDKSYRETKSFLNRHFDFFKKDL